MMLAKYDPIGRRKVWVDIELRIQRNFAPDKMPVDGQPDYLCESVTSLIDAYLVGLHGEVKPILDRIIGWMETKPEPDRLIFSGKDHYWDAWWGALYQWRLALGMAKWLRRGDRAERELTAALDADWQGALAKGSPDQMADARVVRRNEASLRLAHALAANAPTLGLKLYDAIGVEQIDDLEAPLLEFGQWACRHLAEGGTRDATFVARGKEMLTASLLPKFFWEGARLEPALWLKAIISTAAWSEQPSRRLLKPTTQCRGLSDRTSCRANAIGGNYFAIFVAR